MNQKESSHLTYQQRLSMNNKIYYLLIEHKYAMSIINEWRDRGQDFDIRFMKAPTNIQNSYLIAIKDTEGNAIDFVLWCISILGAKPYQIAK